MADTLGPAASWKSLHDRFYSKEEVYEMMWDSESINLANYIVAAAPYGGPIALYRDKTKLQEASRGRGDLISVYTSAGRLMAQIDPRATSTTSSQVVTMGWTASAHLVVVHEDGVVNVYDVHGSFVATFTAAPDAMAEGVFDAKVWAGGLVVLTTSFQMYAVEFRDETFAAIRPKKLADPELTEAPWSWAVIPPEQALSRSVEVLLATKRTVYAVDASLAQDQVVSEGPYVRMALSPSGKFVALYNAAGTLYVHTVDFDKNLSELDTKKGDLPPDQLVWCGTDSVIMYWNKVLFMVGPFSDYVNYYEDSAAAVITETDGVRIITSERCQLLRRVPNSVQSIFALGGTEPPALLYDALEHYQNNSPKAYDSISLVRDSLVDAVEACIDAAGHMFEPRLQRKLLQAASFGKCFLEMYDPTKFVEMARNLRVLNAVRFYEVGMPLTYAQYLELTPQVLINRLVNRHHHLLAYRICEFLELPTDRVLVHWACAKIVRGMGTDHELCQAIVEKLAPVKGISYVEIAETAFRRGHTELATSLLEYEPRPAQQVPLLMTMRENELALTKAIYSGDTDLVYLVLLELKQNSSMESLFRVVAGKPLAADLLATYCKSQDLEMLKDFHYQADEGHESANIMVREAYAAPTASERDRLLRQAITFYAESRESVFEANATKEQLNLLAFQTDMQRQNPGHTFVNLSLSSTIYELVVIGLVKDADKLRKHFKVPDKRYSWLMVRGLAAASNWTELEKFASKSKKSPIGFEPFAQVCIDGHVPREAAKYIPRIPSHDTKAKLWAEIGDFASAADEAFQAENVDMLIELERRASPDVASRIRTHLAKFR
ncbi:vacuolar protein sorting-associated protein [Thecamonas trahens ATCC 50062]|uniref:Vacuolar protein sorting-associated protein n=1 Tax=Thecamonas trahens ATCC 50062 TaxID=461836 RepID=A0A0L0DJV6_THETB|nr:vacuolar protein sorting-associated protein [Thecamonas trahens ATCC 50062]KNC51588.1 vacuolar protein sorting-associated protein [Thecamonas trahens ATCC 50062]|eukprot:XP_013755987.1 vacuolar protein sorting-associated protein [Thecamonas trahens ATCC 50062]